MIGSIISKLNCLRRRHIPLVAHGQWANSPSGDGFDVSECRHCGVEMTRRSGSQWRAVPMEDRP